MVLVFVCLTWLVEVGGCLVVCWFYLCWTLLVTFSGFGWLLFDLVFALIWFDLLFAGLLFLFCFGWFWLDVLCFALDMYSVLLCIFTMSAWIRFCFSGFVLLVLRFCARLVNFFALFSWYGFGCLVGYLFVLGSVDGCFLAFGLRRAIVLLTMWVVLILLCFVKHCSLFTSLLLLLWLCLLSFVCLFSCVGLIAFVWFLVCWVLVGLVF